MLSLGVVPLLPAAAEAVEGDLAPSLTLFGVTPEELFTPFNNARTFTLVMLDTLEITQMQGQMVSPLSV